MPSFIQNKCDWWGAWGVENVSFCMTRSLEYTTKRINQKDSPSESSGVCCWGGGGGMETGRIKPRNKKLSFLNRIIKRHLQLTLYLYLHCNECLITIVCNWHYVGLAVCPVYGKKLDRRKALCYIFRYSTSEATCYKCRTSLTLEYNRSSTFNI